MHAVRAPCLHAASALLLLPATCCSLLQACNRACERTHPASPDCRPAGPPLKLQQMVERPSPLGVEATLGLLRGLHWGVEHGYLDPSPHNEAGAGLFVAGPPGGEGALLCQVGGG